MRYIGNKTKLLEFIRSTLRRRGIRAGRAVDPFTGTASVARELKRLGFSVDAADVMEYGRVFAEAYVVAGPSNGASAELADRVAALNRLPPADGFFRDNFSPVRDDGGRMYFTPENAGRIEAIRGRIGSWYRAGEIGGGARFALLASLIEAADRVANTAGVYAAYMKRWQPNALKRLSLRPPKPVAGPPATAQRGEALDVVGDAGAFDLLYLDPPYNERQYPAYYHVPELIAQGWADTPPPLRGKTGLLPDADKRSDWCRRGAAGEALRAVLATADCRHVVMSYNSEGLLDSAEIADALRAWGDPSTYRRYRRGYKRYRSDADGDGRSYSGDAVVEYLFCVDR
ncbi:MAG TPA: DNA adenine methylase [Longimicrobiales bacterium]|nr:DNA adenine methylase [Longimicrobiales bacterium]